MRVRGETKKMRLGVYLEGARIHNVGDTGPLPRDNHNLPARLRHLFFPRNKTQWQIQNTTSPSRSQYQNKEEGFFSAKQPDTGTIQICFQWSPCGKVAEKRNKGNFVSSRDFLVFLFVQLVSYYGGGFFYHRFFFLLGRLPYPFLFSMSRPILIFIYSLWNPTDW